MPPVSPFLATILLQHLSADVGSRGEVGNHASLSGLVMPSLGAELPRKDSRADQSRNKHDRHPVNRKLESS